MWWGDLEERCGVWRAIIPLPLDGGRVDLEILEDITDDIGTVESILLEALGVVYNRDVQALR